MSPLILALALSAAPPPSSTAAKPQAAAVANDDDKVICRQEQEIGSLLAAKKTCLTKGQWRQMEQDAKDQLNAAQLSANHQHGG